MNQVGTELHNMCHITGLIAFCQKLALKRPGDVGKQASEFLQHLTVDRFLMGAFMSDAATVTMTLIRIMDTEEVDTTSICKAVGDFLDHITWLFFSDGVYHIDGHVKFISDWSEAKPHHYIVAGTAYALGGVKIKPSAKRLAMKHMQAWVLLSKECLEAEFPEHEAINCFGIFQLPETRPKNFMNAEIEKKLARLATMFKRNGANLKKQYGTYFFRAYQVFKNENFNISFYAAWKMAIATYVHNLNTPTDLMFVILHGQIFAPVTSKIEQSFSKVAKILTEQRLNASPKVENRTVGLLLMRHEGAALDQLIRRAKTIYTQCCPRMARQHQWTRRDKFMTHQIPEKSGGDDGKLTEKKFLKRLRSQVQEKCEPNIAHMLNDEARPSIWQQSHEDESQFNKDKLRKKSVQAVVSGHLLPGDHTAELENEAAAEIKRQTASYKTRTAARQKYIDRTTSTPPTISELEGVQIYFDDKLVLPDSWASKLDEYGGKKVQQVWTASMFIANNPTQPNNVLITLAATLRGAWVLSPQVFDGKPGPSIKFNGALRTRRKIWASPNFRASFNREWHVILELLSSQSHKWTILASSRDWANEKAHAESKKRPADVIALVVTEELTPGLKHCFTPDAFIQFVSTTDQKKGSIGLLGM